MNARRASPRPGSSAIERLESRFLLAGSGIDPVGRAADLPIEGVATDSPIAPTPAPDGTATSDTTTPTVTAGRVDTYVLAAGMGEPEVQVQLRWSRGADPADGQLVVLDASGATLLESPLAGVSELRTSVMVPNGQPGPISASSLAIDLTIQRAADGTTDPGRYRLSLAWRPASAPAAPGVVGVVSTPLSFQPASIFSPTPTLPGLDVVGTLPAPPAASAPGATAAGPGASAASPSTGLTLTPPNLSGGPANPGFPAPPATVVGLPPASTPAPSNVGGHASTTPAGVSSAPGTASSSDRDLSTFVGPLPFGASTPDGGIFERSFSNTTSIRDGNAIGRPATATPPPPLSRAIPAEGDGGGWSSPLFVGRGEIPVVLRPIELDRLGPAGEGSGLVSGSAGVAFLPPLGRLSTAERRDGTGRDAEASPPRPRGVRGNPVVAALVAMTSSAAMVLTLGGPDRVRAILAARSSKKRRSV